MPNASISGLGSGLDTKNIVDQLMQLEAVPRARLQDRVSAEQRQVASLNTLNSKLASLAGKADEARNADAWSAWTTSSSDGAVRVAAGDGAAESSFSLTVRHTALSHQLGFAAGATADDVVLTGSTLVRLDRLDGTSLDLETGDGTLQGLVDAVNDPANETGLRANLVNAGNGTYRLLVESRETGQAGDFTLTATDGSAILGGATFRAGRDALVSLGAGIEASSTTNTFEDLLPGIDVTLDAGAEPDTVSEVTVQRDTETAFTQLKQMVDGLNGALAEMKSLTAYGIAGAGGGLLAGDSTVRGLQGTLSDTLYGAGATVSLAPYGLELTREGTFALDEETFRAAYEADPAAVTATLTTGFAERVHAVADGASNSTDGILTTAITGREAGIGRLNDSIESWDNRLELRRTALTRQYTALETALSRMNSQSSWLTGQLGSLNTTTSGS